MFALCNDVFSPSTTNEPALTGFRLTFNWLHFRENKMHQILHLVAFALLHFSPASAQFEALLVVFTVAWIVVGWLLPNWPHIWLPRPTMYSEAKIMVRRVKKRQWKWFLQASPHSLSVSHPPSLTPTFPSTHTHSPALAYKCIHALFLSLSPLLHHILFRNSNSSKLVSSKLSLKTPFKWFSVVQVRVRKGVQLHFVASRFQQKEFWVGVNCSSICGAWIRSEFLSGASLVSYLEGTHFPVRYAIEWQEIIHLVLLLYRNEQSLYLNKRFRMIPYMQCSQA